MLLSLQKRQKSLFREEGVISKIVGDEIATISFSREIKWRDIS
jgi:hypothetical protein